MTKITEEDFTGLIAELMITPENPENPDPQTNGYNWGLVHAEMAMRGVSLDVIKASLNR